MIHTTSVFAKFSRLIALCGALLFVPGIAQAQQIIGGKDTGEILTILQSMGEGELSTDSGGDPMITGSIEGIRYTVFFYSCNLGTNCTRIQFSAYFDNADNRVTLDHMNQWNVGKIFGKAYLDKDKDPTIQMAVNLFGGVTERNFTDTADWWKVVLTGFKQHLDEL